MDTPGIPGTADIPPVTAVPTAETWITKTTHALKANAEWQMWKESSDELAFKRNEGKKEFVKYQMPDDEYVPIDHLPIVCKYTSISTYTFQSSRKKLKTDSFNRDIH